MPIPCRALSPRGGTYLYGTNSGERCCPFTHKNANSNG
nr:MAG TPA: hypothetical protein [Caudoviricetes sp.]